MYIHQVTKQSKYLEKPNDQGNHNDKIEDSFDLMIHRDEGIDNP